MFREKMFFNFCKENLGRKTTNLKFSHILTLTRKSPFHSLRESRVPAHDANNPLFYYSHVHVTRDQGLKHTRNDSFPADNYL